MIKLIFTIAVAAVSASYLTSAKFRVATRRVITDALNKIAARDELSLAREQENTYIEVCRNFGVDPDEQGALAAAIRAEHAARGSSHEEQST